MNRLRTFKLGLVIISTMTTSTQALPIDLNDENSSLTCCKQLQKQASINNLVETKQFFSIKNDCKTKSRGLRCKS
jgi:hypothetical protein